jgi:hypothetical protein
MGTLTVQSCDRDGLQYTLGAASTSDNFANDGKTLLVFVNANASSRTLTIAANDTTKSGYGDIDVPNTTVTVPGSGTNGGRLIVGFFPQARFNDVGGRVNYTLDNATDMSVAAVSVASQ